MPSESLWLSLRDDLVTALEGMSEADGYWYNYGRVVKGGQADWESERDFAEPWIFLAWDGLAGTQDTLTGDEHATSRQRHYEKFVITVAVKDTENTPADHEKKASRIRFDIHKALLATGRNRGVTQSDTFDGGTEWGAAYEGGRSVGGILICTYHVRWDHTTGDMSTQ